MRVYLHISRLAKAWVIAQDSYASGEKGKEKKERKKKIPALVSCNTYISTRVMEIKNDTFGDLSSLTGKRQLMSLGSNDQIKALP